MFRRFYAFRCFNGGYSQARYRPSEYEMSQNQVQSFKPLVVAAGVFAGASAAFYSIQQYYHSLTDKDDNQDLNDSLQTRFLQYATLHATETGEPLMSTGDLFRALLNDSTISDEKITHLTPQIFNFFGQDAKFTISEYVLLTNIIITSTTKFRLIFDMLDLNEDGTVTKTEFFKLKRFFRSKIEAVNHRYYVEDTFLNKLFFGDEKSLNFEIFQEFSKEFQNFVLRLEYECIDERSPNTDGITREHFAKEVLDLTNLKEQDKEMRILRLENKKSVISFEDYQSFFVLIQNIQTFKLIFKFYNLNKIGIGKKEMLRATYLATLDQPDPTENVINLLFSIFDADGDGFLAYDEFLSVLADQMRYKYVTI